MSDAIKHDKEKLRFDLVPVYPQEQVAAVYTFGAKKYSDRNWEIGFTWNRPYGATLRHMVAFWGGEDLDPETGLPHLAHAICELQFLLEFTKTHPEMDNRPKRSYAEMYKADQNPRRDTQKGGQ